MQGVGQNAAAFISGFIDGVTGQPEGAFSKLPDTIAIHGYSLEHTAEDFHQNTQSRKSWLWRINELQQRCNRGGYAPELAVTEWGMLNGTYTFGGIQYTFSETQQAILYMRRALMDGTAKTASANKYWRYSLYFHHPWDEEAYPWFSGTSTSRSIRKVGRILHGSGSGEPGLGTLGSSGWIAAATDANYSDVVPYSQTGEATIRCGWINGNGEKWAAAWRYDQDSAGPDNYSPAMRYIEVPDTEADPGNARAYWFTSLDSYAGASFTAGSIVSASDIGSVTRYEVPNVDENPVFLRFGQ
jgi:hypothetical protein